MNIKLTKEQKVKGLNSTDVFHIMQQVLLRENKIDRDKEHFWIIGLSHHNKILYIELISIGHLTATFAEPMETFRVAVLKGTARVILVHNHPSGELEPSQDDIEVTVQLIQAGVILKIPVIDHIIISTEDFISFAQIDIFEQLNARADWLRSEQEQQKIREEVERKTLRTTARQYKIEGVSVAVIARVTGLTAKEIEKL